MKVLIIAIAIAILTGCGDEVTQMEDNSIYIHNEDGTLIYIDGNSSYDSDVSKDEMSGDFDEEDDAVTCKLNGYFFCPITQKCTKQPSRGSSCRG